MINDQHPWLGSLLPGGGGSTTKFSVHGVGNNLTGYDAITYGPFVASMSYNNNTYNLARDTTNGNVTFTIANDYDPNQQWFARPLLAVCGHYGMNAGNCNQDQICAKAMQTGDFGVAPWCKAYALQGTPNNYMDNLVNQYCATSSPDADFCGCINASPTFTKLQTELAAANPPVSISLDCNSPMCNGNNAAYKPSNSYGKTNCPPQQICSQSITIGEADAKVAMSNVNFSCKQSQENKTNSSTSDKYSSENTTSSSSSTVTNQNPLSTSSSRGVMNIVLIVVGSVLVLIIIVVIMVVAMKKKGQ